MTVKKRYIFLLLFIAITQVVNGKTYYFSSTEGNDSYSVAQAQNPATPWQSLNKLNTVFVSISPGDSILFKRGDEFYGSITITRSGSPSSPIVFGAYGSGAYPVLTGFTKLNSWQSIGNGIWQNSCATCKPSANMLTLNGKQQAIGRYPNTGYLTYQSHSGNSSITDNKQKGAYNWTGAELVVRKNHYIIDRATITAHNGNIIQYKGGSPYNPINNFGYFIQNDPKTLDTFGEWYFDPVNKNVQMFLGNSPPTDYNITISTMDTLVATGYHKSYITFKNLSFEGSNVFSLLIYYSDHIVVQNCKFNYSGGDGINNAASTYTSVTDCNFNNTNNNAMTIGTSIGSTNTNNAFLSADTINNTATIAGMGNKQDGQLSGVAVSMLGPNNTIQNCVITNSGYMGIWCMGDNLLVKNNFINKFAFVKDDAGGIYTYNNQPVHMSVNSQNITGNIVLNGIGAHDGSVVDNTIGANGIYCDNNISNTVISDNTVANCNVSGLLLHDAHEITLSNNTVYNSTNQIFFLADDNTSYNPGVTSFIRNVNGRNNIFFTDSLSHFSLSATSIFNDIAKFGSIDSNYYARPTSVPNNYFTDIVGLETWPGVKHDLNYWKSLYNHDTSSKERPINSTDYVRFEYNASPLNKVITLDQTYTDVKDTNYTKQLTLSPFSSIILIGSVPCINTDKPVIVWNNQ